MANRVAICFLLVHNGDDARPLIPKPICGRSSTLLFRLSSASQPQGTDAQACNRKDRPLSQVHVKDAILNLTTQTGEYPKNETGNEFHE
jgi:hypothetical protein